jgi:hypothetical protein
MIATDRAPGHRCIHQKFPCGSGKLNDTDQEAIRKYGATRNQRAQPVGTPSQVNRPGLGNCRNAFKLIYSEAIGNRDPSPNHFLSPVKAVLPYICAFVFSFVAAIAGEPLKLSDDTIRSQLFHRFALSQISVLPISEIPM